MSVTSLIPKLAGWFIFLSLLAIRFSHPFSISWVLSPLVGVIFGEAAKVGKVLSDLCKYEESTAELHKWIQDFEDKLAIKNPPKITAGS